MSYTPPPPGGNDQPPGGGYGGGEQPPAGGGYGNGGYGSNYPPPPPGGGYGGGYSGPTGDSSKATWALVTGILGLCCGPVGIAAIILGNQAKAEIAASGGVLGGGGKAQAGFILGIIAIVLWIIGVIVNLSGVLGT